MASRHNIPWAGSYWLRWARLPDRATLADPHIAAGAVAAIAPEGAAPEGVDLAGAQV